MSCKTIVSLLMAGFFLCAASASAAPAAAPHTTLTIAMGDPESSEMGVVGNAFKKYVEDKTNGAIQVVCIYGGSPGDDEGERFRKVQKGTLDMALGGIANIVPLEKKLGLLTLPYLFANLNEVVAGTNGAPAELLNKYATEAGFRILTWTYTGFRFISNDKHPITKLSDMKGLKFRVPQSAVMIATYKAFGAIPSLIPWSMTFNALQSGDVDGQCYGYIGFRAMKFNEANQRYLTEVHYTYHLQPLVISERVFEKLTPEVRQILIDAGKYAQEKSLLFQVEQAEASKRELVAGGLKVSQLEDEDSGKKSPLKRCGRNGGLRGRQGCHQRISEGLRQAALELNDIPHKKARTVFVRAFFAGRRENAVARLRKGVRPGPASSTIPFRVPSRESWTRQG